MRLFANGIWMMKMADVVRMASSSNDKFCSLDMLAEVASATLQSDPSLIPDLSLQRTKNKVGSSSLRKSVNSCEKLSLEQIKGLSEKNLIEMFSEPTCDEIKKNYSFQCFLIPDKCSLVFKSFGNETRARCRMKIHLLSHIRDLVAAANATNNHEIFMAEPLHARRKRMKEINRKTTRKKKKNKQLHMKIKKDNILGPFSKGIEDFNLLKAEGEQHPNTIINNGLNPSSEIDYDHFNPGMNNCVNEYTNDNYINHTSKKNKYLPYFHSHGPICDSGAEQVILKGQSSTSDFNVTFPKNCVRRKHRSKHQSDSKKRMSSAFQSDLILKSSSDYEESNSHLNCVAHSESEPCLPVHHDHTYTSVNGKTLNCDLSSASESSKSANKMFRDPFHPKKTAHRCLKKESPLIIPTPPFPYVYIPLLPHIALIQEIGLNFKTSSCKCTNDDDITEGVRDCSNSPNNVPLLLPKENECPKNSVSQSTPEVNMIDPEDDENTPSDTYIEGIMSEDGSNSEASDIKLPDSSFGIDDLLRPECPENLRAVEKKLALKCIRALRTKKKDERGPLTCQICKNKSFTAQATLMYHYRSHAGIKPFSCSVCEATFTRQHSLNYHMLIHNNKSRFVCTDCGRNFRHPSHYKEHLRRHTGETPYECTDCNLR